MKTKKIFLIFSWALYDLANQFFALNVVSLYFVRWLTLEKNAPDILYSLTFGISTFFIAVSGPILGAISDITGRRRVHLVYLTLISVAFTMLLGINQGIMLNLLFFCVANFGCQTAVVFYNALMADITPVKRTGLVSGFGKACGYMGAIVALYVAKPVVLKSGYQAVFFPTGVLFLIFALPCMLFVKDQHPSSAQINLINFLKIEKIKEVFSTLKNTLSYAYSTSSILNFLKGVFFSLCAVNAVILFMSSYATKVFGLGEAEIINLLAFSTLFAILGSFLSGLISDYLGHRRVLIGVFVLWVVSFCLGALAKNASLYWLIGAIVGVALGATWVVSRSLAIRIVPEEKIGEIFGLFNLVGYISAIVGALFWGLILLTLSRFGHTSYRIALFSLNIFMLLGLAFLLRMPKDKKE